MNDVCVKCKYGLTAMRSDRNLNSDISDSNSPWNSLQIVHAKRPFYDCGLILIPNARRVDLVSVLCRVVLQLVDDPKLR